MPSPLERLNLPLAYKRVRDELVEQPKSGRAFAVNAFEQELVETDLDPWLGTLKAAVVGGNYTPGALQICGAPKGGDLVRPGALISLSDRVVYTAAVGACVKRIVEATRWSQRKVDFAPLFHATHPHQRQWLLKPFKGWELWTERSVALLDRRSTRYVVTADIAGFFENVSIKRLRNDLVRIGCQEDVVQLVAGCLNKWAGLVGDRGLPQGVLASDILAKLYLESLDRRIKDDGHMHVRYADDLRVFCRSHVEARRALVLVTELLRERGLTLQSAKTEIRPASAALRAEFAGAVPLIKALHAEWIDEAIDSGVIPEGYASVPVSVIDDLVDLEPEAMDPEVIRRAFKVFVLEAERPNRSMFRYLLRRLASLDDDFAAGYCSARLMSHPEAAPEILRYFADLGEAALQVPISHALGSRDLLAYPYTRYLMLVWLRDAEFRLRNQALAAARKQAFQPENPAYLQAAARAVLGRAGVHSDLDKIAGLLTTSADPFERAQLLCCLTRLDKGLRNDLAGRVAPETPWGARAAKYVRTVG